MLLFVERRARNAPAQLETSTAPPGSVQIVEGGRPAFRLDAEVNFLPRIDDCASGAN